MKKIILIATLLSGCAGQQMLYKPGATPEQVNRDNMECKMEAMKVEASVQNPIIGLDMGRKAMILCLQLRGYN